MSIQTITENQFNTGTIIKVIGVGGGGGNAVNYMIERGVEGAEFIVANTDAQALGSSVASKVIHLGATGLGAGGKPDSGRLAAESAVEEIRAAINGAHMLFITAGMGGGTGTGAAPVIARVAKEMGMLTVAVVTRPFDFEGPRRAKNANEGLMELEANVDSLIVVLNDKLLEVLGDDVTQKEAFAHANDVLKNAVGGIAEVINVQGLINIDFEDVRSVMAENGRAMMGSATVSGPERARIAAEQAISSPLLEGMGVSEAKAIVVLISGSEELKLKESQVAVDTIKAYGGTGAPVFYGVAVDASLGDALRVTVIATGLVNKNTNKTNTNNANLMGEFAMPLSIAPVFGLGGSVTAGSGTTANTNNGKPDYSQPPKARSSLQINPERANNGGTTAAINMDVSHLDAPPPYLRKATE